MQGWEVPEGIPVEKSERKETHPASSSSQQLLTTGTSKAGQGNPPAHFSCSSEQLSTGNKAELVAYNFYWEI